MSEKILMWCIDADCEFLSSDPYGVIEDWLKNCTDRTKSVQSAALHVCEERALDFSVDDLVGWLARDLSGHHWSPFDITTTDGVPMARALQSILDGAHTNLFSASDQYIMINAEWDEGAEKMLLTKASSDELSKWIVGVSDGE